MNGASPDDSVLLEISGPVATVRLNRPDALNACTQAMRLRLATTLCNLADDEHVRAVVLTGNGRAFCAGADLREEAPNGTERQLLEEYLPVFRCMATMGQPVIAAVNGVAAGIGMSLALACDFVLMARDATLLAPFNRIGLVPDGGLCWLLLQQMGYRHALELAVESSPVSANRAVELGLANTVVEGDELLDEANRRAERIAASSALAVAGTKKLMRAAAFQSFEACFAAEAALQEECSRSAFFERARREFVGKGGKRSSEQGNA